MTPGLLFSGMLTGMNYDLVRFLLFEAALLLGLPLLLIALARAFRLGIYRPEAPPEA